jgi:hypothetical protein
LDLLGIDKEKTYQVDPRDFLKVIEKKANIPDYLRDSQD